MKRKDKKERKEETRGRKGGEREEGRKEGRKESKDLEKREGKIKKLEMKENEEVQKENTAVNLQTGRERMMER